MKKIIIAMFCLAACVYAQDKVSVSLDDGGYSNSGGFDRVKTATVEIRKGFGKTAIPVEEKIVVLKQKLRFYELASQHKVDLNKQINATYSGKPLKGILAELLPGVPVKFEGVDSGVTVGEMTVAKTPLETVLEHLDAAAGVYFSFTEQGITVATKPATK